jgi:CBS domain-containing protein
VYKARNIMTEAVICARPEMPIYEAIRMLIDRRLASLPVVDEQLRLLGCLNEEDVLAMVYGCEEDEQKTVGDLMTVGTEGIGADYNLIDMCEYLVGRSLRSAPVTADGKLLGIVSRSDVARAILKLKHQELPD